MCLFGNQRKLYLQKYWCVPVKNPIPFIPFKGLHLLAYPSARCKHNNIQIATPSHTEFTTLSALASFCISHRMQCSKVLKKCIVLWCPTLWRCFLCFILKDLQSPKYTVCKSTHFPHLVVQRSLYIYISSYGSACSMYMMIMWILTWYEIYLLCIATSILRIIRDSTWTFLVSWEWLQFSVRLHVNWLYTANVLTWGDILTSHIFSEI